MHPVRNDAPLGFEPFDSAIRQAHGGESNRTAHGPEYVEGSQRLEFLTGFTLGQFQNVVDIGVFPLDQPAR